MLEIKRIYIIYYFKYIIIEFNLKNNYFYKNSKT